MTKDKNGNPLVGKVSINFMPTIQLKKSEISLDVLSSLRDISILDTDDNFFIWTKDIDKDMISEPAMDFLNKVLNTGIVAFRDEKITLIYFS